MKEEEGVTKERSIKIRECVCRRQDGNIEKRGKKKRKREEKERRKGRREGGRGEGKRWKRIKEDT